jgi:cell division protein FtsQ
MTVRAGRRPDGPRAGGPRATGPGSGDGSDGPPRQSGRRGRWRLVRAGTDGVPTSVRRFMRRARQRRLRAAFPWALGLAVLAVAGLIAWTVYATGVFGVRDVRVVGADLVNAEQVRSAAAVPTGLPLARVDLDGIRTRVAALPAVESVEVSRDWPGTVRVDVVERTAAAVAPHAGRYAVMDASGVVFQTLGRRPTHLPLVRVTAPGPDDLATRGSLEVLAALSPKLRGQLVEITATGPAKITLKLRENRTIVWGDASRSDTKSTVATAMLGRDGDTIDVSSPEVVTIR